MKGSSVLNVTESHMIGLAGWFQVISLRSGGNQEAMFRNSSYLKLESG